ncbi:MAG: transposase [Nostoc sp.]
MYRKEESTPIPPENFELPFEGKLSSDNRWVIMVNFIPWTEFESEYSSGFSAEIGAPAKSFRMALGALIIKEKLGISDRETVEQIKENPYLQYFIGISSYSNETPFDASNLINRQYKMLLVLGEVYRQQLWLYENKKQSIDDRIVSLTQPHIRPIVRGKAGKAVEFGAKLSASCFDGYVFLDHISWDNFNESGDLKAQVESFKNYTGYYPESVHVDKIYRTRENRAWCKERGIRISGNPLGRPPANVSKEKKKQALEDERIRNSIEGKFGQAKRRFSLGRVMAKLSHTSKTAIAITFLVMNLSTQLSRSKSAFLCLFLKTTPFFRSNII